MRGEKTMQSNGGRDTEGEVQESLSEGPQLIVICKCHESQQGEAHCPGISPRQAGVLQDTKFSVAPSSWRCPQPRQ